MVKNLTAAGLDSLKLKRDAKPIFETMTSEHSPFPNTKITQDFFQETPKFLKKNSLLDVQFAALTSVIMTKLFDVKSKLELSTKTEVLNPYVDSLRDQMRYLKGKNETKHY